MAFSTRVIPNTSTAVKQIMATVGTGPAHRTIEPDREVWLVAGILSGLLSRTADYYRAPPIAGVF